MKMRLKNNSGQSLVETIILTPLIFILLAGGWWAYQNISLSDAAESAAHVHLLRVGRNIAPIASELSKTIHHGENTVKFESGNRRLFGLIPYFSGLSGNTVASAGVSCQTVQMGSFIDLPDHNLKREAEGAVDCWDKNTRTGKTVKKAIIGAIAFGILL